MCVVLATIGNAKPSLSVLKACEAANPHGGGVAWREKNRVRFEKGIDADAIHKIVLRERGPFLIHFRIATVGSKSPELCHPFPVSGNPSTALSGKASAVIAHNGTWYNWKETVTRAARHMSAKLPDGEMSDSRAMAWLVAQVGERAFNNVTGRFAYFTAAKGIKLFGNWEKLNGFFASNLNWREHLPKKAPKVATSVEDILAEIDKSGDVSARALVDHLLDVASKSKSHASVHNLRACCRVIRAAAHSFIEKSEALMLAEKPEKPADKGIPYHKSRSLYDQCRDLFEVEGDE
jgi:Glutamine amidotransferase domain